MIILLASIALTPLGPGRIQVDGLSPQAQLLVDGQDCSAKAEGHLIVGDGGCVVKVAIVDPDGSITRVVGQLPVAPPQPPTPAAASPNPAPTTQPIQSQAPWPDSGYALEAGVYRGLADFGFVGGHLGLDGVLTPWLSLTVQWLHGTGRAKAPSIPDQIEHIEETLDLGQALLLAHYQTSPGIALLGGVGGFLGVLKADAIETDTTALTAASQAISGLTAAVGLEGRAGRAHLRLLWNAMWAGGEWYSADDYGGGLGGPPSHFDLLTQGISVSVGIRL